ncbi:hypothetical protein AC1031_007824 [Aphanomyces cochlioides]|nr:hypothetical protein AC1031_007824 [Aphanomyces cochlioides]
MDADLQLKMSKKIAQLTKVIFHLNTKNEDAASELQATMVSHRRECDQVAKDAAAKLAQLKETLEKRDAQLKSSQGLKKVKERHEKEKQDALAEFARYKAGVKAQQQQLEAHLEAEIAGLTTELRKAQKGFQERVAALKSSFDALQAKATDGNAALVAKHTEEVADMVMQSNKKYHDMLTAQLNQQDQLRAEFAAKIAALEQAHELQLKQVKEDAEAAAKAAVRRRELECNSSADSVKSEMVAKMERLLSEIETLRSHETQLRADKTEFQQQLTTLGAKYKQLEIELGNEKKTAQVLQQNADAALNDAKSNLAERMTQLSVLDDQVCKLRKLADALERDKRALQATIDKLESEHANTTSSLSEKEKQWTLSVKSIELELQTLKGELKDKMSELVTMKSMEKSFSKTQDELKMQLLAAQKKAIELETTLSLTEESLKTQLTTTQESLQRQLAACQTELKQLQAERAALSSTANDERGQLNAKIASLEQIIKDFKEKELKAAGDHRQALQQLQETTQIKAQAQQQDFDKQLAAAKRAIATAEERYHEQLQQLETQLKALQDALKATDATSQKEQRELQKLRAQYDADMEKSAKQAKKDKDKLDGDLKATKQALQAAERHHAETVETLKQQQALALKSIQESMAATIQDAAARAESAMEKHVEEQRAFLLEMHTAELAALQMQVDLWKEKLTSKQREMDDAVAALQNLHASGLADVVAKFENQLEALERHWKEEFQAYHDHEQVVQTDMASKHAAEMAAASQAFEIRLTAAEAERERLETLHALQTKQLHEIATNKLDAAEKEFHRQLADLRALKDAEQEKALAALISQHHGVVAQFEAHVAKLTEAVAVHTASIDALEVEKSNLQLQISDLRAEMAQKELAMQREKDEAMELMRKHHKVELEQMIELQLHETQALNSLRSRSSTSSNLLVVGQFEKTRQLLNDQQQQLVAKIREWEQVYARRDSRLEDLNRIADLEHEVAQKDALVHQTIDEMAYIKRELLNREETYNKTFSRSPNVGVLQVLRPPSNLNPGVVNAPQKIHRKNKPQAMPSSNQATRPLPPIGATNQQSSSFRDLAQS